MKKNQFLSCRKVGVMGTSLALSLFLLPKIAQCNPTVNGYSISGYATATQAGWASVNPRANNTSVPANGSLNLSATGPSEVKMNMNLFGGAQGTLKTNVSSSQPRSKVSAVVAGTPGTTSRVFFAVEAQAFSMAKCRLPMGTAKAEAKIILSEINQSSLGSNPLPEVSAGQEVVSDPNREPCSEEIDEDAPPDPDPSDSGLQRFVVSRDISFGTTGQVTVDFPFEIRLSIAGNTFSPLCPSIAETWGLVRLSQTYVYIDSPDIEDSYRKTYDTTQPTNLYRYGVPPNACDVIGDIAVGLKNMRQPSGSISLDTVAKWSALSNQWVGQGIFRAQVKGYGASPSLSWTWSGGTPMGYPSDQIINGAAQIHTHPVDYGISFNGVLLGGSRTGNGMAANSILNLTATNTANNTSRSNFLNVNWHLPLEEQAKLGDIAQWQVIDTSASDWGTLQRTVPIVIHPHSVWWDILGTGTAVAAAGAAVVFPQAALVDVAVLGLTGANLGITSMTPQDVTFDVDFGYREYARSIIRQYEKNTGVPGTANNVDTVFSSSLNATQLAAEVANCYGTLQLDSTGNGDPNKVHLDPNYANSLYQSRVALARNYRTEEFRAYHYDINGFNSYVTYPLSNQWQYLMVNQVRLP